jgi:hypothetical protein
MAVSVCSIPGVCAENSNGRSKSMKPVIKLLVWTAAILFFMLYAGPKLGNMPMFKPIAVFIEENDINANMYFYTEVEEFSEANINMQNTMDFPPNSTENE